MLIDVPNMRVRIDQKSHSVYSLKSSRGASKSGAMYFTVPQSPGSGFLCANLCVLCVSVVYFCSEFINHRDTENAEVAPRNLPRRKRSHWLTHHSRNRSSS